MRHVFIFFLSLFFLSACNNKKENPPIAVNGKPDSSTRVRSERTVNPYAPVDVSPMDMSYFPVEYPKLKMSKAVTTAPLARIVYSRPHLQGRSLFGEVLKHDEPWRLGANEATEIEFYKPVTIQGKSIDAGRYIMYCIPHAESWTVVINSNTDTWGLEQDVTQDVARFTIPIQKGSRNLEYYTMVFEKTESGANLLMAWDTLEARLPIRF